MLSLIEAGEGARVGARRAGREERRQTWNDADYSDRACVNETLIKQFLPGKIALADISTSMQDIAHELRI